MRTVWLVAKLGLIGVSVSSTRRVQDGRATELEMYTDCLKQRP